MFPRYCIPHALLILVLFVFTGCESKVKQIVDAAFPPVNHEQAQKKSISSSYQSLNKIDNPDVLLNVDVADIQKIITANLKDIKNENISVVQAKVKADSQGFKLSVVVDGKTNNPKGRFRATLDGWVTLSLLNNTAKLTPGLYSAKLDSLNLDGLLSFADEKAASTINFILKNYIENANSLVKPIEYQIDIDKLGLSKNPIEVKLLNNKSITIPGINLYETAVLLSSKGLHLISTFEPKSSQTFNGRCSSYSCLEIAFWEKANKVNPNLSKGQPGLYLSKDFITKTLAPAFPPVTLADLKLDALKALTGALRFNGQIALGASIGEKRLINELSQAFKSNLRSSDQVQFGDPLINLSEQTVEITLPIKGFIESAHIKYSGRVRAGAIISSTKESLYYRIVLAGIEIESLEHTEGLVNPSMFVFSINKLVSELLPNLNSAMDNIPIKIPLPALKSKINSTKDVKVSPEELQLPNLEGVIVVPRLTKEGLRVLVIEGVGVSPKTSYFSDITKERASSGALTLQFNKYSVNQWYKDESIRTNILKNSRINQKSILKKMPSNHGNSKVFEVQKNQLSTPHSLKNDSIKKLKGDKAKFIRQESNFKNINLNLNDPVYSESFIKIKSSNLTSASDYKPEDLVETLFQDVWNSALPKHPGWSKNQADFWATASTLWVVSTVNRTFHQNNIKVDVTFDSGILPYDTGPIELAKNLRADCAPNRQCQRRDNCELGHCSTNSCSWDCRRSLPFGGSYDDPFCKAGEAACNIRAEADRAVCNVNAILKQTACNAREEAQLGACKVQREAEIMGCNVIRELIAGIHQIDELGTADGEVRVNGHASIGTPLISFNHDDSAISLKLNTSVDLIMKGDVNFIPREIGHLLFCPVKGKVSMKIIANIPQTTYTITSRLTDGGVDENGGSLLKVDFDEFRIKGSLSPSPIDALVTQNPQIFITCSPVLNTLITTASITGKIQAFGPADILKAIERAIPNNQERTFSELKAIATGEIDMPAKIPSVTIKIPTLESSINGGQFKLEGKWEDGYLVFKGN